MIYMQIFQLDRNDFKVCIDEQDMPNRQYA